jgi:hypothetical protein
MASDLFLRNEVTYVPAIPAPSSEPGTAGMPSRRLAIVPVGMAWLDLGLVHQT